VVCVIDISYSDIVRLARAGQNSGFKALYNIQHIVRATIVLTLRTESRNVSYQHLTTTWDVSEDFTFPLPKSRAWQLRRRFWNGIGLAVLLTRSRQPLNGYVEIERQSHGRFTAVGCRSARMEVFMMFTDAYLQHGIRL
jgi:hypothetical protein